MPCNSDYLLPTDAEKDTSEVAQLLAYVKLMMGEPVHDQLISDAYAVERNKYPDTSNLPVYVSALCAWLGRMTSAQRRLVFIPHPTALKLKEWQTRHEEADRIREANESANDQNIMVDP